MDDNTNAAADLERVLFEIKKVIVGQDHMVERLLVALLARGHILLEGLPGLAKTLAVSTMAKAIGGSFVRLQFTPDLLPSDLVGTRIWRAGEERFDIEWGPVFANLLLTDEINRAPAKVQSALLEVMAERQVSIGGLTRPLPQPFLVLATQNPVESEGVYTLPEAQRDRFLMKVTVGYPSPSEELEIVRRVGVSMPEASEAMTLTKLEALQGVADRVYVDNAVAQYAVDLVMATREPGLRGMPELEPLLDFGVSPRATIGLVAASRALAVMRGRGYVVPQDTFDVARDVLRHRVMLSYEALAKGLTADDILNRVLAVVPAASVSPMSADPMAGAAAVSSSGNGSAEATSPMPTPSDTFGSTPPSAFSSPSPSQTNAPSTVDEPPSSGVGPSGDTPPLPPSASLTTEVTATMNNPTEPSGPDGLGAAGQEPEPAKSGFFRFGGSKDADRQPPTGDAAGEEPPRS